jgi:hypothetical protein
VFRLPLRGLIGPPLLAATVLALSAPPALATLTAPPTLFAPAASSQSSAQLHVHYYLPEVALAGSVELTFEGGETIEVHLNSAEGTMGEHEFTLNVKSPTGSPAVASASKSAIPDGSYTVKLTYQGATAASPASVAVASVGIDTVTHTPSLLAPAGGSVIGEDFTVEYLLPEAASPGTAALLLIRAGGATSIVALAATTAGTHSVTLNPFDLAVGGSLTSGPSELENGEYTLLLSYQDALLNPAASSSTTLSILRATAVVKGSEVTSSSSTGTPTPSASPAPSPFPGNQTPGKPARLSVRWKSSRPTRSRARALTATFSVVSGARRYTLAIRSARVRRSFACRVSGAGRRRRVTCLAHVPSKGRWSATATAVGAAGTLASTTTNVRFRS